MIPIATTHEAINSHGGLNLIGKLVDALCPLSELFIPAKGQHRDRLSDADILKTQLGLYALGRSHYEDSASSPTTPLASRMPAHRRASP